MNQTSKQSVKIVIGDVGKKQKRKKRRVATAGQRKMTGQSMNYGLGRVHNSVGREMGTRIIRYGDDFGTASASVGDDRRMGDGSSRGFQQNTRTFANDNFNPLTTPPPQYSGREQVGTAEQVERAIQTPANFINTATNTPQVKDKFVKTDDGSKTIQQAMLSDERRTGLTKSGKPSMRTKLGNTTAIYDDLRAVDDYTALRMDVNNGSTLVRMPPSPNVDLNPHSVPPPPQLPTARAMSYLREVSNLRQRVEAQGSGSVVGGFKQYSDRGSDAGSAPMITPSTNSLGGNSTMSDRGSDA